MTIPNIDFRLLPYGMHAVGLILTLILFISVKREVARNRKRGRDEHRTLQESHDRLKSVVAELEVKLKEVEERSAVLVPPPSSLSGMNMNKRAQAVRMFRRGDRPEQIAAALSLPQNEVSLILKVHQATAGG